MWSREKEMVRFGRLGMGSQGPGGTLWPNTSFSPQPAQSFLQPGRTGQAVWGLFPPRPAAWGWILASETWSFYFFSAKGSANLDYYRPSFRQRSTSRHLKMGSNILQGQTRKATYS